MAYYNATAYGFIECHYKITGTAVYIALRQIRSYKDGIITVSNGEEYKVIESAEKTAKEIESCLKREKIFRRT